MCFYSKLFLSNEADHQEEIPFVMPDQGRSMTTDKAADEPADNDESTDSKEEESGEDEEDDKRMKEEKEHDEKGENVVQETGEEEDEDEEEKEPKWIKVYKIDPPTPPVGANHGNPFEKHVGEFDLRQCSTLSDVVYAIHDLWAEYTQNRKRHGVYGSLDNAWPGYHVKFYSPNHLPLEATEVDEELENHDNVVLGFVTVTKGQDDQPDNIPIFLERFDHETGDYKRSEAPIAFLPLSGCILGDSLHYFADHLRDKWHEYKHIDESTEHAINVWEAWPDYQISYFWLSTEKMEYWKNMGIIEDGFDRTILPDEIPYRTFIDILQEIIVTEEMVDSDNE